MCVLQLAGLLLKQKQPSAALALVNSLLGYEFCQIMFTYTTFMYILCMASRQCPYIYVLMTWLLFQRAEEAGRQADVDRGALDRVQDLPHSPEHP